MSTRSMLFKARYRFSTIVVDKHMMVKGEGENGKTGLLDRKDWNTYTTLTESNDFKTLFGMTSNETHANNLTFKLV